MSENVKKEPDIRFEGFVDDWEQRKLGDLATSFEYGLNASAKGFDGIHKYIRITDIDDSSRKFNHESLTSPDIDLSSADNYKLKDGDILFARTGASVGKTYIYTDSDGLVYYAGFLIRARIKSGVDSNFVFQHTLTSSYENFIRVISQRSGQPGVNAKEYSIFEIGVPSYEEQHKIGTFFKQLDSTLTLHQQKLELLKKTKKGYLQKMFPKNGEIVPEIRFEGFKGDWFKVELKELCSVTTGFPFKSSDFDENGKYLVITNANIQDDKSTVNSCIGNRINIEFNEDLSKYILNIGDILVTMDGTVGRTAKVDKHEQILAQRVGRLSAFENGEFLYQYLNNGAFSKAMLGLSHGGTIKHISLQEIESFMMIVPSAKEQVKIGNFFKTLDEIVDMEEKTLKELKYLKKSLLQKMFI